MDIKLLTKEQDTIRFVLSDVSPAFANALRRIILAEVPVMAIEDVMILENSSVMYDEILAHRLGLIPITTDQSYNLPEECTCKSELGCEKCRASLSLEGEDFQFFCRINWNPTAREVGSRRRSAHQRENLGIRGGTRRNF